MNQLMERMCSISNCCASSRDTRDRSEQSPLFERRCSPGTPAYSPARTPKPSPH